MEETFKRLNSHKGVIGVVVINMDGIAIKVRGEHNPSTWPNTVGILQS